MHETTEERVQRGLETLAQDIRNLFRRKEQQTQSHITRSETEGAKVVNIINNNIPDTKDIPVQSVRFGFLRTSATVVFLVVISAITWLLITNPQSLVNMWYHFVQLMRSI